MGRARQTLYHVYSGLCRVPHTANVWIPVENGSNLKKKDYFVFTPTLKSNCNCTLIFLILHLYLHFVYTNSLFTLVFDTVKSIKNNKKL